MRQLLAFVLAALCVPLMAFADPVLPDLNGKLVVDQAHLLTTEQAAALAANLHQFSVSKGPQIAVVTIPTLDGADPIDYGNRLFRHLKLGDAKRNDGVLLLIAVKEHKSRIEVGYGLEGQLTDAASNLINTREIVPRFKQGDFNGGITAGVQAIEKVVTPDPSQATRPRPRHRPVPVGLILLGVFVLLSFCVVIWLIIRQHHVGTDIDETYPTPPSFRPANYSPSVRPPPVATDDDDFVGAAAGAAIGAALARRRRDDDDDNRSSGSSSTDDNDNDDDTGGGGSAGGGGDTSDW